MLVSTQTQVLGTGYGDAKAIQMLHEAGFPAYDFTMQKMLSKEPDEPLNADNYVEYAKGLRALADELGMVCNQAHAPFTTGKKDQREIFDKIVRSMEVASILGAEIIVVHPIQHLPYDENVEELYQMNMEFYKSLIPYCEKFQIKVALENMYQTVSKSHRMVHSTCSRPEEFCRYLDDLNSEWLVGCLDIGHIAILGESIERAIHMLGKKRLQALHVHDNNLIDDQHMLPYMRNINFDLTLKALRDIGYEGDFTFEADRFLRYLPKGLIMPGLKFMLETGRYMASQIEEEEINDEKE